MPLPIVQIALGALLSSVLNWQVEVDPELFLLLFIAPLLFLDAWRIPKEGLFRDKWTIVALALGLVVFTVLGAGLLIHLMLPAMPLAVAFALAGILSPTDAVAVSAIAKRTSIPKRLMHILEGEALLNDASGLVCARFAVAAVLTGTFSPVEALWTFAWLAVGGLVIGAVTAVLANGAKDWMSRRFGEEVGTQILLSLLLPFGAYLLATSLHSSGILAAVAAGIAMNYEERTGRALPITRVRRAAVWDALQFAGNGAIFVLLGDQLPGIVAGAGAVAQHAGLPDAGWLVAYILLISLALLLLRALWSWMTLGVILFRDKVRGRRIEAPGWRLVAVISLGGVRGALTLSAVMALPLALPDGAPFPARDLAILLAAGIIVVSLVAANAGLPYVARHVRLPVETARQKEEDEARLKAAEAAIGVIERNVHTHGKGDPDFEAYIQAATRALSPYRQRLEARAKTVEEQVLARKAGEIERRLRVAGLRAERDELYRMARSGHLSDEAVRALVRELDLQEARYGTS
ncbi:Na+/H+ antiporter [Xanthobacter sp. VNH20]|uniref:Na+/H+ antiporter n=1 Tax=Xanthobacter sp. VNH20 TaxID=3156616 RepID=UPI0032B4E3E5